MSPTAIVTGAARGIGAATVKTLASQGWSVLAVDRCADDPDLGYPLGSRAELEEVATSAGPDVVAAVADVRQADAMAEVVAETEERWGGLDAAIAAAGVIAGGVPGWELALEQERAVLE
ncbi:MAG TPA: SDR family NAD(P)-dependent oxidoreductase, partial [Acidimicrobiales bacterium]|nr:SDR family NAD(P)-dependent oxidoreductase [Acidimicrobiales bacterium]